MEDLTDKKKSTHILNVKLIDFFSRVQYTHVTTTQIETWDISSP